MDKELIEKIKMLETVLKHIRDGAEKCTLFPGDRKDILSLLQKAYKPLDKASKDLAYLIVEMNK